MLRACFLIAILGLGLMLAACADGDATRRSSHPISHGGGNGAGAS